jgi:kynurenine formamidase
MIINLEWNGAIYKANLAKPKFLSIPLVFNQVGLNCFYAPHAEAYPVKSGEFVGSIEQGGAVNFFNLRINPHGNGTHTECQSHIYSGPLTINECLEQSHYIARIISVYPQKKENGDLVIEPESLMLDDVADTDVLVIRTMPNDDQKLKQNYSGTNPPYLSQEAAACINQCGYKHLLIDLPSIDREEDGGLLAAHKAFWHEADQKISRKTITELIYIPNEIKDAVYLLSFQIAPFQMDVSPSRIAIFELE